LIQALAFIAALASTAFEYMVCLGCNQGTTGRNRT